MNLVLSNEAIKQRINDADKHDPVVTELINLRPHLLRGLANNRPPSMRKIKKAAKRRTS